MLQALPILALAFVGNDPLVEQLPPFGLTAPYQGETFYQVFGLSDDGRYLLRNALDPENSNMPFYGVPAAVDLQTGKTARLDLTLSGGIPELGECCLDPKMLAFSGDARFILFYSNSPSYGVPQRLNAYSVYWVDRDSDQDGIFDEIEARRIERIAIIYATPYPLGSNVGLGALSDDGRYAAFQYPVLGDPHRVELRLADLDSDDDGILAEPGEIEVMRVVGEPSADVFPLECSFPTFSKDARFLAFDRFDDQFTIGYRYNGGSIVAVASSPPGYPLVRRTIVLDRDSDENGIFDEPYSWTYTDLGAIVGANPVDESTWPQFVRERDELIFVKARANEVWGNLLGYQLMSFDPHSRSVTQLVPTATGAGMSVDFYPRFACDGDARRIFFMSDVPVAGATANYETEGMVLDRDVDRDGVFDEVGDTQATPLKFPNGQWVNRIFGASNDAKHAVLDLRAAGSMYDPLGVYLESWVEFDCVGSVSYDLAHCSSSNGVKPDLYGFGCPASGESFVLEVDGYAGLAPLAWIVVGTPSVAVTDPCALGFTSVDFALPVMMNIDPNGTNRHAKFAFQFPKNFPAGTFELRAVAYFPLFGKQVMSRRLRITTP